MTLKKIMENLTELAGEDMTEDGVDHDYWCDHEEEYVHGYILRLVEIYDVELPDKNTD